MSVVSKLIGLLRSIRGQDTGQELPHADPLVPSAILDRALTTDEEAALRMILDIADFPGGKELRAQVPHVWVTRGRTTELSLEVRDGRPASVQNGVLPVEAQVLGPDDESIGVITVWVAGGYLEGIEYSWFTDRMPRVFPPPDRLRASIDERTMRLRYGM